MRPNPILLVALALTLALAGAMPPASQAETQAPDLTVSQFAAQFYVHYLPIFVRAAGGETHAFRAAAAPAARSSVTIPAGAPVTFSITIANQGNAASLPTGVAFFVDGFLARLPVPALGPGQSAQLSYVWIATSPGLRASQSLRAVVDDDQLNAESDETNNEATAALPAVGPPALEVTSQTAVTPAAVLAGAQGNAGFQDVAALAAEMGYTEPLSNTVETHYSNGAMSWAGEFKRPGQEDDLGLIVVYLRQEGQTVSFLIERLGSNGDFRMFDRSGGLRYVGGVISTYTPAGQALAVGNCSEPWFWICVGAFGLSTVACIASTIASFVPPATAAAVVAAIASCGGSVASGYECIQRLTDNDPTIYIREAGSAGTCQTCEGGSVVTYQKIRVEASGTDDRGPVDFPGGSSQEVCLNRSRTVSFTGVDCGGNSVTKTRTFGPRQVSRQDCKTVISPPECAACENIGETAQCVRKEPCGTQTPRPIRVRGEDGWRLIVPTPIATPVACAPTPQAPAQPALAAFRLINRTNP